MTIKERMFLQNYINLDIINIEQMFSRWKTMSKILVKDTEIQVIKFEEDYISLTDMVRNIENGVALIEKWLRNKNTIEFLGIWEELYNE